MASMRSGRFGLDLGGLLLGEPAVGHRLVERAASASATSASITVWTSTSLASATSAMVEPSRSAVAQLLAADADGFGGGVETRRRSARRPGPPGPPRSGRPSRSTTSAMRSGSAVDGGLEALGGGRHHGVDHGLHVDAVGLGDLSDRLAVLEGGAQLVLGDADRLGGDVELDAAAVAAEPAVGVGSVPSVVGVLGAVLGEGEVRGPEDRAGCPAAREGEGEGGGPQELAVAWACRTLLVRWVLRGSPCLLEPQGNL